jgi:hypothetical protein
VALQVLEKIEAALPTPQPCEKRRLQRRAALIAICSHQLDATSAFQSTKGRQLGDGGPLQQCGRAAITKMAACRSKT